jgi:hypothetical protein
VGVLVEGVVELGWVTSDREADVVTARLGGRVAHPPAAAAPSRVAAVTVASSA